MTTRHWRGGSILIFISFVLINCGGADTANGAKETKGSPQQNTPDNSQKIESEARSPMIEIWQDLEGSVAIRGRSLYFRMYDDGVVEFDHQVRKERGSTGPRFLYHNERTPAVKISEEEFTKLRSLLDEIAKSKAIKPEYKPVALTLDVLTKLTIQVSENGTARKNIIINDSDYDIRDRKFEKIFPRSLISLFTQIHLIRQEQIPKE